MKEWGARLAQLAVRDPKGLRVGFKSLHLAFFMIRMSPRGQGTAEKLNAPVRVRSSCIAHFVKKGVVLWVGMGTISAMSNSKTVNSSVQN